MEQRPEAWNSGYVTDLEYTHGFYRELEPGYLSYCTLLSGHLPPDTDSNFTYCELGCGNGLSTNIIASAWPNGQFYGIDFNPSHIVNGTRLAATAGLDNMKFLEADFRGLKDYDLPEFDFIVAHGVLSWINDENRHAIRDFVLKKLKPGGILYLSYNCLPGWASAMPIRELMKKFADDTYGSTIDKVTNAIQSVDAAFKTNQGFFHNNPMLQAKLDQIKSGNKNYIAHEYFNRDWQPFYHSDIATEFENAKVSFIGSAELYDTYLGLYANEQAQRLIQDSKNPMMKETLKDFYLNRMFRKDLFMRGSTKLLPKEQAEKMYATVFGLTVPLENVNLAMKFSFGEAKGREEIYTPVVNALASQPRSVQELCRLPELKDTPPTNVIQTVNMLSASGQAGPASPKWKNKKTVQKMNSAILGRALYSSDINYLVSPQLRSGILVNWFDQLFLIALQKNTAPDEFAWTVLQSLNQRVQKDGKPLDDPDKNLEEIKIKFEEFRARNEFFFKNTGIAG